MTVSVDGFAARQRVAPSVNSGRLQRSAFRWLRHLDRRPWWWVNGANLAQNNIRLFVQAQIPESVGGRHPSQWNEVFHNGRNRHPGKEQGNDSRCRYQSVEFESKRVAAMEIKNPPA